ncbi:MAG: Sir2 family NAD-dependent protein deacetylase [Alphaproteobacteria bacterium]|nr:Sir2 family NAD-dependent protein deacetylase [Alphaproteobacteria bacterium]
MIDELFITGAGVSKSSGIPTFRGNDGFWKVGSDNYTPQEMATRAMYENNPAEFLLWYFKRFASYRNVKPNAVHFWLANKKLITQNIDGLDGRAGNEDYISIHGRLDKVVLYQNELNPQIPFEANWNEIDLSFHPTDEELKKNLLDKFKINSINNNTLSPQLGVSLKPYVLLFDEIYTDIYRISEAEEWMNNADKIIFIGTSFSVNITSIAVKTAISNGIDLEIVDPEPINLNYDKVTYHKMTGEEYCNMRKFD